MRVAIIGAGIGGMALAIKLAKEGHQVTVYEKNEVLGGRAGVFEENGFTFDMGPSWYLMPDVFERFFNAIGENVSDYLDLVRLDPSYRVFFEGLNAPVDVRSTIEEGAKLVESMEPGAGAVFKSFMKKAKKQHDLVINHLLYTEYRSPLDLISKYSVRALTTIPFMGSIDSYLRRFFKNPNVRKLLEYSMVFLGVSPYDAPAFYALMPYVDFGSGVFYPQGGIHTFIDALETIGKKYGVEYVLHASIEKIDVVAGTAKSIQFEDGKSADFDVVVSNADLHFTETKLLDPTHQTYPNSYWEKATLAPSMLLIYLGIRGKVREVQHHTLYFADDWKKNFDDLRTGHALPQNPSYYICAPSKTDPSVAPEGDENLFVLVPIPSQPVGKNIDGKELADYVEYVFDHIGATTGITDLKDRIVYKKVFGPNEFSERYNSIGGTGLGIAHTLRQSLFLRPTSKSKKVKNLYYTGSMVQPGIGMPMCLISAELTARRILDDYGTSAA